MSLTHDSGVAGLTAGEAELRLLLDNIPARVALLDRQRRHCYVNQEYVRFVGRPAEAILGRTVADLIGTGPFAQLRPYGDRALAGEPVSWEGWMPHHEGREPRFVQRYYVPYRRPSGSVDGYFILTRDMTELKQSEQRLAAQVSALHASEALATAITTAALDCVVVVDESERIVVFNPAAEATFGYDRTEVIGRSLAELIVPPGSRAAHLAGFNRYLRTGDGHLLGRRIEMEAMRSDGSTFPVELAITEVVLPDRRLFTAYLRDLTAAKRAEAEIRRQRNALYESEKLAGFGSLLAGVAHELNNPLSILIGHADLLEEEAQEFASSALAGRAGKIRLAAQRCAQTVRTFLAMARQRGIRRERVAPNTLIQAVLDLLGDEFRADGIEFRCDVPASLPAALGDPDQLHHVMTNLVINARQALLTVALPRHIEVAATASGKMLEITVADNGPGVPELVRGRIFDPFFTTKKPGAGTGIGLAVSKGIVEAHGGTLTLDRCVIGGARFVLRLPLAQATEAVYSIA
jgi:PAS domain S-box-containing protein